MAHPGQRGKGTVGQRSEGSIRGGSLTRRPLAVCRPEPLAHRLELPCPLRRNSRRPGGILRLLCSRRGQTTAVRLELVWTAMDGPTLPRGWEFRFSIAMGVWRRFFLCPVTPRVRASVSAAMISIRSMLRVAGKCIAESFMCRARPHGPFRSNFRPGARVRLVTW